MRKWVRRILKGLAALLVILAIIVIGLVIFVQVGWDRPFNREVIDLEAPSDEATVARGAYLYNEAMLCWSCHGTDGGNSPDEPQAGGIKFDLSDVGPGLGVYYASNLTPDPETGIGNWSDGELVRAIREGMNREGTLIFPVMSYKFYHGLSDDDALALVAYLRSLEPVRNDVLENAVSFVAKVSIGLRIIKPEPAITEKISAPPQGPTAEYGEYLAWHASGCAECHMPRSPNTGAIDLNRIFAGALMTLDEPNYSVAGDNLTPDEATGIGNWTKEQFMAAMRTGVRPDGTVMLPFMPWPWYQQWSENDLTAVWLYLRSLEPVNHEPPDSQLAGVAADGSGPERGEALYQVYCSDCHGVDRRGSVLVPTALGQSVRQINDADLAKIISEGPETEYMPGFGETLSKEEISDLLTFFRQHGPFVEVGRQVADATSSNTQTSISQFPTARPAGAPSTTPRAEPSPTQPAQSTPLTEVEFTLRTEITGRQMLYVGVGGDIEGIVNPDLVVSPGTIVRAILVNGDGISHDLFFPDFGAQSGTIGRKGQTTEVTFSVPADYPAGTHLYYCTRSGHRESGQEGLLIVKQAE